MVRNPYLEFSMLSQFAKTVCLKFGVLPAVDTPSLHWRCRSALRCMIAAAKEYSQNI